MAPNAASLVPLDTCSCANETRFVLSPSPGSPLRLKPLAHKLASPAASSSAAARGGARGGVLVGRAAALAVGVDLSEAAARTPVWARTSVDEGAAAAEAADGSVSPAASHGTAAPETADMLASFHVSMACLSCTLGTRCWCGRGALVRGEVVWPVENQCSMAARS